MRKTLYISAEILKWDFYISGFSIGDINNIKRPYEMLSHSESLIKGNSNEFSLSDAILNLKRALNNRLKTIELYYNLDSIKFKAKPKGKLETLELYGLARPYIIKKLMEIRNNIEHNDAKPPRKERCKELIDITWYFLKSTDRLIYYIPTNIEIIPKNIDKKHSGSIKIKSKNKKIELNGWFPANYVSNKSFDNSIKIICSGVHVGRDWKSKNIKLHNAKSEDDIWLIGNLIIDDNNKHEILKKFFESI